MRGDLGDRGGEAPEALGDDEADGRRRREEAQAGVEARRVRSVVGRVRDEDRVAQEPSACVGRTDRLDRHPIPRERNATPAITSAAGRRACRSGTLAFPSPRPAPSGRTAAREAPSTSTKGNEAHATARPEGWNFTTT